SRRKPVDHAADPDRPAAVVTAAASTEPVTVTVMSFLHPHPSVIDLGVNIDHVATLRNARGTPYPDPLRAALLAEEAGADLITLHLREDRRHIRDADVKAMRPRLVTRMNLECAVTPDMLDIACAIRPQDVC